MSNDDEVRIGLAIKRTLSAQQEQSILLWARRLNHLKRFQLMDRRDVRAALCIIRDVHVLYPLLPLVMRELKWIGWDKRSWPARFAVLGAVIGAVDGQNVFISASGIDFFTPLWVLVGAGAALAGVLLEQLLRT